ncbi:MAG: chromate transporter [Rikenellaceae bacterium]
MLYIQIFISFFKIGIFGFGGGYAMLSLIQSEVVVKHQWLSHSEFADVVAISQMTPGPISINSATYIGYTTTGSVFGSLLATLGVCAPSLILMLIGGYFFTKLSGNRYVLQVMRALRPVIIGLILSAALLLCTKENFIDYKSFMIFAIALAAVSLKKNPILIIIVCGVIGYLVY